MKKYLPFLILVFCLSAKAQANVCIQRYQQAINPKEKVAALECAVNIELVKKKEREIVTNPNNITPNDFVSRLGMVSDLPGLCSDPQDPCFNFLFSRPFLDASWEVQAYPTNPNGNSYGIYTINPDPQNSYVCIFDTAINQMHCFDRNAPPTEDYYQYCNLLMNYVSDPYYQVYVVECAVNTALLRYRTKDVVRGGPQPSYYSATSLGDMIGICDVSNPCFNSLGDYLLPLIDSRWNKTTDYVYENVAGGTRCTYDPTIYRLFCDIPSFVPPGP